tara:strand:- start:9 stop:797 length:789 start_codon:yes stop_codon:yes gene_type:complete
MLVKNSLDPSLLYLSEVFDNDETLLVDISILADYDKDAICWMVESPDILQEWGKLYRVDFYDAMNKLLEKNFFKHVITADPTFAKYECVHMTKPCAPSWIKNEDAKMYEKSDLVTFITSAKTYTPLQKKRRKLAEDMISKNIKVYGRGFVEVDNKLDVLKHYRFCVVIENGIHENYHTEKILDCLRTGTVPIYLGDPMIGNNFNIEGMITVEDTDQILEILDSLSDEKYESMLPAIQDNLERALKYDNSPEKILEEFFAAHK